MRTDYEKTNTQIAVQKHEITVQNNILSDLQQESSKMGQEIDNENKKIAEVEEADKHNILVSEISVGAGVIGNILTIISNRIKHNEVSDLEKIEQAKFDNMTKLAREANKFANYVVANQIVSHSGMKINRKYIYSAAIDGFNYANMKTIICSQRYRDLLVIITTDTNYKFGAYLSGEWPCVEQNLVNNRSFSYTVTNTNIAYSKNESVVITDDSQYLLNIGEGEILIFENKTGCVSPGKNFELPAEIKEPEKFYTPTKIFNVTDIEIQYLTFKV